MRNLEEDDANLKRRIKRRKENVKDILGSQDARRMSQAKGSGLNRLMLMIRMMHLIMLVAQGFVAYCCMPEKYCGELLSVGTRCMLSI